MEIYVRGGGDHLGIVRVYSEDRTVRKTLGKKGRIVARS